MARPKKSNSLGTPTIQETIDNWEMKDRTYVLTSKATPVSFQLQSRHTEYRPLTYFDPHTRKPLAMRYVNNQPTFFIEEQVEPYNLEPVIFEDGKLFVPATNPVLQQFLHFHPYNDINMPVNEQTGVRAKGLFKEYDAEKEAQEANKQIEAQFEAMQMIVELELEDLEAIARVFVKGNIEKMSLAELKRAMFNEITRNPRGVIAVVNDPLVKERNLATKVLKYGLIVTKDGGSTFAWADGEVITKIPVEDINRPAEALARFFQSDEGIAVKQTLKAKLY